MDHQQTYIPARTQKGNMFNTRFDKQELSGKCLEVVDLLTPATLAIMKDMSKDCRPDCQQGAFIIDIQRHSDDTGEDAKEKINKLIQEFLVKHTNQLKCMCTQTAIIQKVEYFRPWLHEKVDQNYQPEVIDLTDDNGNDMEVDQVVIDQIAKEGLCVDFIDLTDD